MIGEIVSSLGFCNSGPLGEFFPGPRAFNRTRHWENEFICSCVSPFHFLYWLGTKNEDPVKRFMLGVDPGVTICCCYPCAVPDELLSFSAF